MQANMSKIGQFGHTFKRGFVRPMEQLVHSPGPGPQNMWRNITLLVGCPSLLLAAVNCMLDKHEHKRPEVIYYPYMKILNKPFPWGDGKHSLFHNPKTNYIPGIGYEE